MIVGIFDGVSDERYMERQRQSFWVTIGYEYGNETIRQSYSSRHSEITRCRDMHRKLIQTLLHSIYEILKHVT